MRSSIPKSEGPDSEPSRFVELLQQAVTKHPKFNQDFIRAVQQANKVVVAQLAIAATVGSTRKLKKSSLRVTHPTKSFVSAKLSRSPDAKFVEAYMTRRTGDSVAETVFIGRAKYRDADGHWRIPFMSERFEGSRLDPLAIHIEVLGAAGQLLAARALAPMP